MIIEQEREKKIARIEMEMDMEIDNSKLINSSIDKDLSNHNTVCFQCVSLENGEVSKICT